MIVIKGELTGNVIGSPIPNLRLYPSKDGIFMPIRYQIDEMTEDGNWILPGAQSLTEI